MLSFIKPHQIVSQILTENFSNALSEQQLRDKRITNGHIIRYIITPVYDDVNIISQPILKITFTKPYDVNQFIDEIDVSLIINDVVIDKLMVKLFQHIYELSTMQNGNTAYIPLPFQCLLAQNGIPLMKNMNYEIVISSNDELLTHSETLYITHTIVKDVIYMEENVIVNEERDERLDKLYFSENSLPTQVVQPVDFSALYNKYYNEIIHNPFFYNKQVSQDAQLVKISKVKYTGCESVVCYTHKSRLSYCEGVNSIYIQLYKGPNADTYKTKWFDTITIQTGGCNDIKYTYEMLLLLRGRAHLPDGTLELPFVKNIGKTTLFLKLCTNVDLTDNIRLMVCSVLDDYLVCSPSSVVSLNN